MRKVSKKHKESEMKNMQILVIQEDKDDTIEEYLLKHDINAPTPENVIHVCEEITEEQAKKTGEKVIHDDHVKQYVGIGWMTERPALVSDFQHLKIIF